MSKSARLDLRIDPATLARWRKAAKAADMKLSAWVRAQCDAALPACDHIREPAGEGAYRCFLCGDTVTLTIEGVSGRWEAEGTVETGLAQYQLPVLGE